MMKMWRKGAAWLLVIAVLVCQMAVFGAEDTAVQTASVSSDVESRLKAFGIFGEYEQIDSTPLTRADMAAYLIKAKNVNIETMGGSQTFIDVGTDSTYYKAVEAAYTYGIVKESTDGLFHPEREVSLTEAVTMAVRAMNREGIADMFGGWPQGYLTVASQTGLIDGIGAAETLTKADAAIMIDNMLDAPSVKLTYSTAGETEIEENEDITVLEDYFDVTEYRADIDEINKEAGLVTVTIRQGEYAGHVRTYEVSDKIDLMTLGGTVNIYVDEDENIIIFAQLKAGSEVIYDFIEEVNKLTAPSEIRANDIKYIYLKNEQELYKADDDMVVYYNGEKVDFEAYDYTNCFAKVFMQDGFIIRLEMFTLKDGGLLYFAEDTEIRFTKGTDLENQWTDLDSYDTEVYIDGRAGMRLRDLKTDMVFDYWTDGDSKLMIIASSRAAKGKMEAYTPTTITIDGEEYDLNTQFGYYNFDLEFGEYQAGGDHSKIMNEEITAFIDDNKTVRYIRIDYVNTNENLIKGIVTNAYYGDNGDDKYIKIYDIEGRREETSYKVAQKLGKSEFDFDYVKGVSQSLDGRGFLQFTLNSNNEIQKIESIPYWGYVATQTGSFNQDFEEIGGQYAAEADIFAASFVNGKYTVKKIDYEKDLIWSSVTSQVTVISDFDLRYNPVPNFIMLGENSQSICGTSTQSGIIKNVIYVEDDVYKIELINGIVHTVSADLVEKYDLKKNMLLEYKESTLQEEPILVVGTRDLSMPSDEWETDTFTMDAMSGFFKADELIFRNSYVIQFMMNGEPTDVYKFQIDSVGTILDVYKHTRNAFEPGSTNIGDLPFYIRPAQQNPVMNIKKGDKIWFHVTPDYTRTVDYIIYESSGSGF